MKRFLLLLLLCAPWHLWSQSSYQAALMENLYDIANDSTLTMSAYCNYD